MNGWLDQLHDAVARPPSMRVLLVAADRSIIAAAAALEHRDDRFDVETTTRGGEALARLTNAGVDCVVVEDDLPDQSAIQFIEAVRDEYPTMPVILVTSADGDADTSDALAAGATDCLRKAQIEAALDLFGSRIESAVTRYHSERRAHAYRNRYSTLFEQSPHAIAFVELDDAGPIVRATNARFDALFVASDADPKGASLEKIVAPTTSRTAVADRSARLAAGQVVTGEWTGETTEGPGMFSWHAIPVDQEPAADSRYAYVVYTDSSHRRMAVDRFRTFVRQSSDIIAVLHRDGTFRYQSPAVERVLGYAPSELVGENAFEFVHPDDRAALQEEFERAVADPDVTPAVEYRFRHADGEWRWLESQASNQFDNPAVEGFVVNSRDITDRKRREQRLRQQNEQLEAMAAVASHDLRNPLNVAIIEVEMARQEHDSERLETVVEALDRMDALIENVLGLATGIGGDCDLVPVDLASTADASWRLVETDEARLVNDVSSTIQADPSRLQQLLENLFRNAVEHADEAVTVTVGDLETGFFVADDGPGIPESRREEVFDPGFTTRDDGTGFGLNIVRDVVEAHGWEIRVTDSRAGGARFEITVVRGESPRL